MAALLIFSLLQCIALILGAAWLIICRPYWLRHCGNGLVRLADASIAAHESFRGTTARKLTPDASDNNPLRSDVISALVNLGTPKARAKAAAEKAHGTDFESAFRDALQYARIV
jgi:hypothetical protein